MGVKSKSASAWKACPDGAEYAEVRERLISATAVLLAEKGLERLRLDEVAAHVGCARSSVYRYFDSKEQLVFEVMKREFAHMTALIWDQVQGMSDPVEQVVESAYLCIEAMRNNPHVKAIWNPERTGSTVMASMMIKNIPDAMADSISHIFLKEARDRGLVRENVSNKEALRWLLMIVISHGAFGFQAMSETEEKDYLRKMLIPSLFSPDH